MRRVTGGAATTSTTTNDKEARSEKLGEATEAPLPLTDKTRYSSPCSAEDRLGDDQAIEHSDVDERQRLL
jgi:hypothetical protein